MDRTFYVETPLGRIKVYAKHEVDNPADYPGLYIDFISNGAEDDESLNKLVAVVEYDPFNKCVQTCIYQPWKDEPMVVVGSEE